MPHLYLKVDTLAQLKLFIFITDFGLVEGQEKFFFQILLEMHRQTESHLR